jgi:hypothetical protein
MISKQLELKDLRKAWHQVTFLCQLQLHLCLVPGKMKKMLATLMTTYSPLFKASSTTMLVTNFMFALTDDQHIFTVCLFLDDGFDQPNSNTSVANGSDALTTSKVMVLPYLIGTTWWLSK